MSFKRDQNKNQNRSIDKEERKKVNMRRLPRQDSGHNNFSYKRYAEKLFTQIKFIDLYGDAMLVLVGMGTNRAVWDQ